VRIEGEALVEDRHRSFIRRLAAARSVLKVEQPVGLGIEAQERDRGRAVVAQKLAVEAEELAEEPQQRPVKRPVKLLFPSVRVGGVARVRVAQRLVEPDDQVPARRRASEEVVSNAKLAEQLVCGLPVGAPITVGEEGEQLGSFCVGAAPV
jgi:hypothetical protein